MEKQISVKAHVLKSTEEEKARNILKVEIYEPWANVLREWFKGKEGLLRLHFEEWSTDPHQRAVKLYHAIVDRIVKEQEGAASKAEHMRIHEALKESYGPKAKSSLSKEYTMADLWNLTQGAIKEALETGADISDLMGDYKEIKYE